MPLLFQRTSKSGAFGFDNHNLINIFLRFFQFVLGLAVVGLYAQDLNRARKQHAYADAKWVCSWSFFSMGFVLLSLTALSLFSNDDAVGGEVQERCGESD